MHISSIEVYRENDVVNAYEDTRRAANASQRRLGGQAGRSCEEDILNNRQFLVKNLQRDHSSSLVGAVVLTAWLVSAMTTRFLLPLGRLWRADSIGSSEATHSPGMEQCNWTGVVCTGGELESG